MKIVGMAGVALMAILPTTHARGVTDRTAVMRERVLSFAKANLGRRVGNGECAALAFQALRAAGAKPRAAHGFPSPRDYVWGKLVLLAEAAPNGPKMTGALGDVRPGDIAQFSNARLGRAHFAHHTAVVADISDKRLGLLEQKVGGRRFVVEGAIRLDKLSAGWIRFYRPVPAHS
jgi:myosin tail region-interacting protein MTI1